MPTDDELVATANRKLTEVAAQYLDELIKLGKNKIDARFATWLANFKPYIERTYKKCNSVKLMIDRDRIYELKEIYVKSFFTSSDKKFDDEHIVELIANGKKVFVQGFGGIGKTMLLKHAWMSLFSFRKEYIPIFIELRKLNELSNKSLMPYIRNFIFQTDGGISDVTFAEFCKEGRLIFLLDGFDEINDEFRKEIEAQIINLAYNFPKCGMLVSSRFDDQLRSWEQFQFFQAHPFNKKQIEDVINKVKFDEGVKKAFLADVINSKYETYSSFLSTPLLALMMLLTFDQFADVPEKVHISYRYAFQTLYSLHDAAKDAFQRKRKTSLNEDDFCKVFSFFCLFSYKDSNYSFGDDQIRRYVDIAKKRAGVDVDTSSYIAEAMESVNLIYKEGNVYSFVHRSFQEYFTAYCIMHYFNTKLKEVMMYLPSRPGDTTFRMLYEMNPDLVEDTYLLPTYDDISSVVSDALAKASSEHDFLKREGVSLYLFFSKRPRAKAPFRLRGGFYLSTLKSGSFFTMVELFLGQDIPPSDAKAEDIPSARSMKSFTDEVLASVSNSQLESCVIEISFEPQKATLIEEDIFEDEYRRIDHAVEISKGAWESLFERRALDKHIQYAISVKARYVALQRIMSSMRKRYLERAKMDDEVFS